MNRLGLAALLLALASALPAAEPAPPAGPDPQAVVGAPRGAARSGDALEGEADRVASLLRCPVCQGLSVKDSPVGMAVNMRHQVREMVAAGYDEEQILSYFEQSYGEFVRLQPPLRGVNWLVWAGPLAALAAGGFAVRRFLAGQKAVTASPVEAGVPGPDTLPEDPNLARYVLKVRERAYGWPAGKSPAAGEAPR